MKKFNSFPGYLISTFAMEQDIDYSSVGDTTGYAASSSSFTSPSSGYGDGISDSLISGHGPASSSSYDDSDDSTTGYGILGSSRKDQIEVYASDFLEKAKETVFSLGAIGTAGFEALSSYLTEEKVAAVEDGEEENYLAFADVYGNDISNKVYIYDQNGQPKLAVNGAGNSYAGTTGVQQAAGYAIRNTGQQQHLSQPYGSSASTTTYSHQPVPTLIGSRGHAGGVSITTGPVDTASSRLSSYGHGSAYRSVDRLQQQGQVISGRQQQQQFNGASSSKTGGLSVEHYIAQDQITAPAPNAPFQPPITQSPFSSVSFDVGTATGAIRNPALSVNYADVDNANDVVYGTQSLKNNNNNIDTFDKNNFKFPDDGYVSGQGYIFYPKTSIAIGNGGSNNLGPGVTVGSSSSASISFGATDSRSSNSGVIIDNGIQIVAGSRSNFGDNEDLLQALGSNQVASGTLSPELDLSSSQDYLLTDKTHRMDYKTHVGGLDHAQDRKDFQILASPDLLSNRRMETEGGDQPSTIQKILRDTHGSSLPHQDLNEIIANKATNMLLSKPLMTEEQMKAKFGSVDGVIKYERIETPSMSWSYKRRR